MIFLSFHYIGVSGHVCQHCDSVTLWHCDTVTLWHHYLVFMAFKVFIPTRPLRPKYYCQPSSGKYKVQTILSLISGSIYACKLWGEGATEVLIKFNWNTFLVHCSGTPILCRGHNSNFTSLALLPLRQEQWASGNVNRFFCTLPSCRTTTSWVVPSLKYSPLLSSSIPAVLDIIIPHW